MQRKLHQIFKKKKRTISGFTNIEEEVIMVHKDGGKKDLEIKQLKKQN